ncbi:nuclear transcription factor Y subunit gamma-like [Planococcus citri]|uniref:nuclear transcription factor Y subunit gamma-like n=1 Tax=Planococcus citri TaxID=170843 RepID=UPI0031F828AE
MSVYFINSASEEEIDSPTHIGESNGHSSESESGPSNDPQYGELTLQTFWPKVTEEIRKINVLDIRNQALPLARIKKIMKLDEDVKMISAEAPMLFAKAAELFIMELTLRAWVHTEDNKRRTLQRSDIAMAITKYDQFDFLIDIVPREEAKIGISRTAQDTSRTAINSDQVHYYFQLAQQQSNDTTPSPTPAASIASPTTVQVIQPGTGQIQTVTICAPGIQHA